MNRKLFIFNEAVAETSCAAARMPGRLMTLKKFFDLDWFVFETGSGLKGTGTFRRRQVVIHSSLRHATLFRYLDEPLPDSL